MQSSEVVLSVLAGASENNRVAVCMHHCAQSGCSRIRFREETFSSDVGWFVQRYIDLCPNQVAQLRQVLGKSNSTAICPNPAADCQVQCPAEPVILKLPVNRAG